MLYEHFFDFFMILILVFALYRGAAKGFVYQVATIAAIVFCFFFAGQLSSQLSPVMQNFGAKPPLDRWLAMLTLYVGFSFLAFGAARILRDWLEKIKLKEYDRHLGAVLGLFKGFVFCLFAIFFLVTISESSRAHIMNSYSGKVAAIAMDRLHPVLPEGVSEAIHKIANVHALDRDDLNLKHSDHDHHGHNHGDGHVDNPFDDDANDPWIDLDRSKSNSAEQGGEDYLKNFVTSLPGLKDNKTRNAILGLLENTTPEQRKRLMNELQSGGQKPTTDFFQSFADHWLKKGSSSRPKPSASIDRQKMITEIAALQSKSPQTRKKIIETANTALKNVPTKVADGAVADWYADLFALDVDPDPETDFATLMSERITRQIKAVGIPLSNVPKPFFKN